MSSIALEEDSIDEILYLARANEVSELESYLSQLSAQTKHSKAELVAAATDPNSKNSALHYAAANGNTDIIHHLLSYSPDQATSATNPSINLVNNAGNSPLHWAALNGHLDCVKLLIESGANATIINQAGHDAVFEAEINDKKDVVDWLLGALEALEKGIGQEVESPSASATDDMEVESGVSTNGLNEGSGTSAGGIEVVRRQMEKMETTNGATSQGG